MTKDLHGQTALNALQATLAAAIGHIQAGRLDQAAAVLQSAGGAARKNPVARNIMGDIHLKQGRARDALREFDAAIGLARGFPEAHCNRVVALQELGRLTDALAAEDKALALRPKYATAHFNRGNILKDLGRSDEAIAAYGRALETQPAHPEALVNRAMARLGQSKAVDALDDFRRALALRPGYAGARIGAADALSRLKQVPEALAEIDRVLADDAENRDALLVKAGILRHAERAAEALAIIDAMLARDASDASVHVARSQALTKLDRLDDALAAADVAIGLAPKSAEAQLARGLALAKYGRFEEALAVLDRAERLGVSGARLHRTRAIALCQAGRFRDGIAALDRALAEDPDSSDVADDHYNRAFALLSLEEYAEGWQEHQWRLKLASFSRPELLKVAPLWDGEDIRDKKVLLYSEQGAGDTIQFVRYALPVAARGARISMVVHESLRRLFAANFPDMDISDTIGMRTGFDYQSPLMSLPHVLGTNSEAAIPVQVPYLAADPDRVAKWAARIGDHGFRVGISWQGNSQYSADRFRSIPLARFAPLARVPGVRLISVQALWGMEQLDTLPAGMTVETLGEELVANPDGFREMAAVMANLDLMIVSDSAPAHLAGALGRPVWVALAKQPDWRWLIDRTDSPWYPTMRLFRQKTAGDWAGLFEEIAEVLAGDVPSKGQP